MLQSELIYQDFLPKINLVENDAKIKTLTFQVTDGCNLCCIYCYQTDKHNHVMPFEVAKRTIDWIFDNKDNPTSYFYVGTTAGISVEFIGGEPLLEMPLIRQIVDYFEEQCLQNPDVPWFLNHCYTFSSNGTLFFNKDVQEFLQEYNELTSFNITIDGNKELHDKCRLYPSGKGSYDEAIEAAKYNLYIFDNKGTKITLSPSNVQYVYHGILNLIDLGFSEIQVNCAYEPGWTIETAQILYEQLKLLAGSIYAEELDNLIYIRLFNDSEYMADDRSPDHRNWCGCADMMYAIDYKGDLYPCIRYMESSLNGQNKPLIIGNVYNNFIPTEEEQKNLAILNLIDKANQTSDKDCHNCPIQSGCAWCSAYNYQCGDINHKATNICIMHKAMALGAKYYYLLHKNYESYCKINITKEIALEIISEEEWNSLQWKEE